jgi:hypothetical protein
MRSFKKGELITPYLGPVRQRVDFPDGDYGDYSVHLNAHEFIDGRSTQSSLGRYANDCRSVNKKAKICRGKNAKVYADTRNRRGVVRATKNIPKGSEVFVSYGVGYWARHNNS